MRLIVSLAVTLALAGSARAAAPTPDPAEVISTGRELAIVRHLVPEKPTIVLFVKTGSTLERGFVEQVRDETEGRAGIRLVLLKTGAEPAARQYEITETPTALVYDRRGRLLTRTSDAAEIRAQARKAAEVMRLDWPTAGDPRWDRVLRDFGGHAPPGIMRTLSYRPDYMELVMELSQRGHFADGFINRRTKEMIATYVSALNHCKY